MTTAPLTYTRDEAAAALRTSKDRIDKEIHSGRLKAKQIGRRILIRRVDLEQWLDEQPDA